MSLRKERALALVGCAEKPFVLAIDHREALRGMLASASGLPVSRVRDDQLIDFKANIVELIGPWIDAVLVDTRALDRIVEVRRASSFTFRIIVAVDSLAGQPGQRPERAGLDRTISVERLARVASGVKLLAFLRPDLKDVEEEVDVKDYKVNCTTLGMPHMLEILARADARRSVGVDWANLAFAAGEVAKKYEPDIAKLALPVGEASSAGDAEIVAVAERLSTTVEGPWLLLSSGIEPRIFPRVAGLAGRGGASGVVAGRAVWCRLVGMSQGEKRNAKREIRLQVNELRENIDRHCVSILDKFVS